MNASICQELWENKGHATYRIHSRPVHLGPKRFDGWELLVNQFLHRYLPPLQYNGSYSGPHIGVLSHLQRLLEVG